jgi:hypothetical protein
MLPKESNGTGILLIPISAKKETSFDYFVRYRVVLSDGTVTYLHPKNKYGLIKDLAPGSYYVEYIESMYIESGRLMEDRATTIRFEIEADTITTLDSMLSVRVYRKGDLYYQSGQFTSMTAEERALSMQRFSENRDLGPWSLN